MTHVAVEPDTSTDELWDDAVLDQVVASLLEGKVIPVVGPDLLKVEVGGQQLPLDQYLAQELAARYKVSLDSLPSAPSVNGVVGHLLRRYGKSRSDIRRAINQILRDKENELRPSQSLLWLAEITHFNLFVSTTFDPLLEKAINQARFGGEAKTEWISFSPKGRNEPKQLNDLRGPKDDLRRPTVFHLMGKAWREEDYVISDEDLLERICQLQSRSPENLFDELKENHLLILGQHYSDWLARIFLRTAKGGPLSHDRERLEVLADANTCSDQRLVWFLCHFSKDIKVHPKRDAEEFVKQLWMRWKEVCPEPAADAARPREIPQNGVFISYKRDDQPAVERLAAGLKDAGVPVWFDRETLGPGDSFQPLIKDYIARECGCFVAVISKNTERHDEGWFRREWKWAVERDEGIHGRRFILPVIIDDTARPEVVPPRFKEVHYTWLPDGRVTEAFAEELAGILRKI